MNTKAVLRYIEELDNYVTNEDWKGYDPYDILNSRFSLHKLGKYPMAILTQIQKRNPINLRPLLGIEKEKNPKGMGLFLWSYSKLFQLTGDMAYKDKADQCYAWLLANRARGYQGASWGYNFGWANPGKVVPRHSPNIVVTGFVCNGIFAYYDAFPKKKDSALIKEVIKFIQGHLLVTEDSTGCCVSYTTLERDVCYNASLQAAEIFAWYARESGEEGHKEFAQKLCAFVLHRQHPDGSWDYSERVDGTGKRIQLDFHQGYILDSLMFVQKMLNISAYDEAIAKGYAFYKSFLVHRDGSTPYRYPAKYPVDIHNQAQALITSGAFGDREQLERSLAWTVKYMRSRKGYFYYKKYPWLTLKTPYIRWSQAWMMVALVSCLLSLAPHEEIS